MDKLKTSLKELRYALVVTAGLVIAVASLVEHFKPGVMIGQGVGSIGVGLQLFVAGPNRRPRLGLVLIVFGVGFLGLGVYTLFDPVI